VGAAFFAGLAYLATNYEIMNDNNLLRSDECIITGEGCSNDPTILCPARKHIFFCKTCYRQLRLHGFNRCPVCQREGDFYEITVIGTRVF